MPKFKQVLNNVFSKKEERAEQCIEHLKGNSIKICNTNTGKLIEKTSDLGNIGILRYSDYDVKFQTYCLTELKSKGFVRCEEINRDNIETQIHEASENNITQAINGITDVIKIPNTISTAVSSIGKLFKASGKEVQGCQFIVRDFNLLDKDKIDFSAYTGKTFDDLYISDVKMNDLASKAIHIAEISPEFITCLYDFSENLSQDSFIFQPALNTEL